MFDEKPVFYQLVFLNESSVYRYGFEVKQNAIAAEWLYIVDNFNLREAKLFTREENVVSVTTGKFNEAKKFESLTKDGDSDIFQSHSLFLSATAAVGIKLSKVLQQFIKGKRIKFRGEG